ncbi:MAG: hypothetical protein NW241_11240 [Bacteroidia bacterium]|nr:hypothetical protein [Bacteroidia bacterium]
MKSLLISLISLLSSPDTEKLRQDPVTGAYYQVSLQLAQPFRSVCPVSGAETAEQAVLLYTRVSKGQDPVTGEVIE